MYGRGLIVIAARRRRNRCRGRRVAEETNYNCCAEEQEAERDGAGGVEEDIAEAANSIGQEGLVKFVGAGDQEGCGNGKSVGSEAVTEAAGGLALDHPEGAEADE
jgi:hypothetical protein